jgi:alkylation response protein AidB-like acyl-CoA dehydrogenase
MATTALPQVKHRGGSFLIEGTLPEEIFTPEDFTEEHLAIARTTDEFFTNEVAPNLEAIQHHEPGVTVGLVKKSGELGLTGVDVPEKYGGMEMDLASMMIVGEHLGKDGSYAVTHAAQVGIGTLPVLLFGTEDQKQRYLPKLASAELIAAYCLTEAQAGSDALACRTRADLSADGTHYVLNGQKMWITNGAWADLFTIFAKVDGEKFTAFLVDRGPGVLPGAEEKKMGIKGSSTTAVYIDNVKVPVENVLGEVGRGHIIAFNILNLGRLKLGPIAVGASKEVLRLSLKYAKERRTFGKPIAEYGMIRQKLAQMAIRIYAAETMAYRVVGLIEDQLKGFSWDQPDANKIMLKAVEEYAAECSYIKLYCSETLDFVTDEGVQIHGGYGYHQDYAVERAYRDSRINRIFEGTNEINRLLATGMLLKRAQQGRLPLVEAVKKVLAEVLGGSSALASNGGDEETKLVANAKKIALLAVGIAYQKFMAAIEEQQEIVANLTDIAMNVFAMESVLLRTRKLGANGKGDTAREMCAVFLRETLEAVESAARAVLAAASEGDSLRTNLAVLKRFAKCEPVNAIALRRSIAGRLLQAERYTV